MRPMLPCSWGMPRSSSGARRAALLLLDSLQYTPICATKSFCTNVLCIDWLSLTMPETCNPVVQARSLPATACDTTQSCVCIA